MTTNRFRVAILGVLCLLALAPPAASAAVGLKLDGGWEVSFDGFVNAFAVDQLGRPAPLNAVPDVLGPTTASGTFRVRTGLLPGLFAFNVEAPDLDGLKLRSRIGFYPQINNGEGLREQFGSQVDLREAFFTVEGAFGQVLAGRALNLFQGKNILTDMSLFGVGVEGKAISAGTTTAGRIGYGYVYTSFGAQARYTTPDLSGVKLAVEIGDPSSIGTATGVRAPDLEGELSWSGKLGEVAAQAWVSGLVQRAWFPSDGHVTAAGGAAGAGATVAGLDLLASGFYGRALGTVFMLEVDALDSAGHPRNSAGFLVQGAYTVAGKTKLGVSYGQTRKNETAADATARETGTAEIDTRRSVTFGAYHDVNRWLKVVGEYTLAQTSWFGGAHQASNVVAFGGFVFW
jgi:hypothetical protein